MSRRHLSHPSRPRPYRAVRGFVVAYLLFALSLAGLVTVAISQLRNDDVQARKAAASVEGLVKAISIIEVKVKDGCRSEFVTGGTVTLDDGTTVNTNWPVFGTNGVYTTGSGNAADVVCPGTSVEVESLWSGRDGVFFPAHNPSDFQPWQYVIQGSNGALTRIELTLTNNSGAQGLAVMRRVAQRILNGTVTLDEGQQKLKVLISENPA